MSDEIDIDELAKFIDEHPLRMTPEEELCAIER
jgi:hypothetical protein